jgi:hypothetical protein
MLGARKAKSTQGNIKVIHDDNDDMLSKTLWRQNGISMQEEKKPEGSIKSSRTSE